jgi:predicted Fe-Mo cluster-binding NifX family protein
MIVCVPIEEGGQVGHSWGRASNVAIAEVREGQLVTWRELAVGWDALHDVDGEGGHHARIARVLREERVQAVLAGHMGPPMQRMIGNMGIDVHLGVTGDARSQVLLLRDRPIQ